MRALTALVPAVFALTITPASPLAAHAQHRPAPAAAQVHKVEKVAENVYCIFGQGGNVVLENQVNAIIAHTNVRRRMVTEQAKLEPAKRGGLPELALGSEDVNERARLNIHLDLPYIDTGSGGSFDGLASQVVSVAAWIPDGARTIPGHGPVCGKKELLCYRDFLKVVQAQVKANPSKDAAALAASFDKAAWPEWTPRPEFVTWETLFAVASGKGPGRVARP